MERRCLLSPSARHSPWKTCSTCPSRTSVAEPGAPWTTIRACSFRWPRPTRVSTPRSPRIHCSTARVTSVWSTARSAGTVRRRASTGVLNTPWSGPLRRHRTPPRQRHHRKCRHKPHITRLVTPHRPTPVSRTCRTPWTRGSLGRSGRYNRPLTRPSRPPHRRAPRIYPLKKVSSRLSIVKSLKWLMNAGINNMASGFLTLQNQQVAWSMRALKPSSTRV